MGVVSKDKAGVGSAVNDATRLLGGTLGVAIIGSVYASLYAARLTASLPARIPAVLDRGVHESVGAALEIAQGLERAGHAALAGEIQRAASGAFIHGLSAGCLVACGVAIAGAIMAALLLPAQPAAPVSVLAESTASAPAPAPVAVAGPVSRG